MRLSHMLFPTVLIVHACSTTRFRGAGDPAVDSPAPEEEERFDGGTPGLAPRLGESGHGDEPPSAKAMSPVLPTEGGAGLTTVPSVMAQDADLAADESGPPNEAAPVEVHGFGPSDGGNLPCTGPDCSGARCGDGIVDVGEECDGETACSVECLAIECGNGRLEDGEECEPNQAGSVVCSESCRAIECGNRRIDEGEECEPPDSGRCSAQCTLMECGNGRVDEGEECDHEGDDCSPDCQLIACGNARIDPGEGCEPPGSPGCDAQCRVADCGNGRVDEGEECDPPSFGSCDGQCRSIECGNGRVDEGEDCEPPGTAQCNEFCRSIACGDGRLDGDEECDPPSWGDCNASCQRITCGDGRLDEGEQCEPDLVEPGQCTSTCSSVDTSTGAEYLYTFDSDTQQWFLYDTSPERLLSLSEARYDAQNGDVSPGVLRLYAPFDASNQKLEAQVNFSHPRDWSGRTLTARVRLGQGLSSDSQDPGGIKLYAKAGDDYDYASGPWTHLTSGQGWVDVTLDLDAPILLPTGKFDATQVRELGVELRVFNETDHVAPAVVYLDSVSY